MSKQIQNIDEMSNRQFADHMDRYHPVFIPGTDNQLRLSEMPGLDSAGSDCWITLYCSDHDRQHDNADLDHQHLF